MKPTRVFMKFSLPIAAVFTLLIISSCQKSIEPSVVQQDALLKKSMHVKSIKSFMQRNLVANMAGMGAEHVDPTMVNAWGLAFSSGGTPWISANVGHVSNVYDSVGHPVGINPVTINGPAPMTGGGTPTGIVFNGGSGFQIPSSPTNSTPTAARFIFVGDDGVISAWSGGWGHNSYRVADHSATSAYFGLTLATSGANTNLYAANFGAGHIDVWNSSWQPVNMSFTDPNLPSDYSPFNIQAINNQLYVMYAQQETPGGDEVHALGAGLVDVYSTNGMFIKRLATGGTLNAPWGAAMAPSTFVSDDDDASPAILIGNFGDGHINAYRASDGKFLGQLSTKNKQPVVIDGLWAISFAPVTSPINPNLLYFTAGPNDETAGLFGYLSKMPDDDSD
jgi:uncharacterized protein (TIGR03118 family)